MAELWNDADKFQVLFGCALIALFSMVGGLFAVLVNERKERRSADARCRALIAKLNHKYNLINATIPRMCDAIVALGGPRLIEQHHSGDWTNSNLLFNPPKEPK